MLIEVAGLTDRGRVRRQITDHLLIAELNKSVLIRRSTLPITHQQKLAAATVGHLMLVADAGGDYDRQEHSGEDAAVTAVEYVQALLPWFFDAVRRNGDANHELARRVENVSRLLQPPFQVDHTPNFDSSLTIAFLVWPTLFAVDRGNNGIYLLRGDQLHHLTTGTNRQTASGRDHASVVVPWSDRGQYGEMRSACATLSTTPAHVHQTTIAQGDTIMLCTDGLTRAVSDEILADILRERRPPDSTCLMLIHAANDAGGLDNTSVVVAHAIE